jgi:hypothetical protein
VHGQVNSSIKTGVSLYQVTKITHELQLWDTPSILLPVFAEYFCHHNLEMALATPSVLDEQNAGVLMNHPGTDSQHDQTVAAIEEFFQYRPSTFRPAKGHTTSDKTRPPGKFDRHLAPSLRLRRVVYMPSIEDDLKEIAEGALRSASEAGTLPPVNEMFPAPTVRDSCVQQSAMHRILREAQIQSIYNDTTARFCSVVASTLEFQLPRWNCGHLQWTIDSNKSRGVSDGNLSLNQAAIDQDIASLPVDFTDVAEDFPVLAIWEFKSLKAGTPEVFEAIVQQSASTEDFPWEGCEEGLRCRIVHNGEDGGLYITGSKTAFDAQAETCTSMFSNDTVTLDPPSSQPDEKARIHARYMTQQVNIVDCFPFR